ncbi:hypothetical protein SAMN05421773_11556 [Streptomyces aidingensis]|uniref:DUF5753 domain-containing protein n=1 Tax=Streptomyces aidingensis TaxID=910347 RepID=A0A1I1SBG7_9ACTN|nr:hypothetical protein SAMN05421773_11556 [Streptomyces aidingensis]
MGRAAGYSEAYVSRVESGQITCSEKFAEGCDLAFGTNGLFAGLRKRMLEADSPNWFIPYLEGEQKADHIEDYSTCAIMGLLQTEEYARAIFRAGFPSARDDVIQGKVDARLVRRKVIERENPPTLWLILHEACLRTVVGGPTVMAEQLDCLITAAQYPHIDIQVITYAAGAAAAHVGPFTLLLFESSPTLYYADGPQGGRMYEKEKLVAEAVRHYDRLRANALAPDDSLTLLKALHKEYTS